MLIYEFQSGERFFPCEHIDADLVGVGGGLAGVCCSITAVRESLRVILAQDRPLLGGNASSEVRLWALGPTSHMGSNNRWAREDSVINEIPVENVWRNPGGNSILFSRCFRPHVAEEMHEGAVEKLRCEKLPWRMRAGLDQDHLIWIWRVSS